MKSPQDLMIDCKCFNRDCRLSIYSPEGIGTVVPFDKYKEGILCKGCNRPLTGEPEKAVDELTWELMIPIESRRRP
jgi:hypothetical protein